MKKNFVMLGLISVFLILSCSKDEIESGNGKFNIYVDGKILSAKYVNIPIPTESGTFSCQYNKPGRITIWVLIDNSNDSNIDICLPTDPVPNKVYNSRYYFNSYWITFINMFDNINVDKEGRCRTEVVFTSFKYPGLIQGTIKLIEPSGSVLLTGEFDFIAE